MDLLPRAISFACRRHQGQTRKDGETPYVAHPMRVMTSILREFGEADPEALAAAALHDTVEDTATDFDDLAREFGETVARYVALLTKDKRLPEEERERRYFEGLRSAPAPVKLCKIADTLDNLRDAAAGVGGNLDKTRKKAERLFDMWEADPACARALAVLRAELDRGGAQTLGPE
jgi:(p)ppGpp synthase/HD superfamily hydrolase